MFLKSRFVVIDDKEEHLRGIKSTLNELRLDCHTKHYTDDGVAGWGKLPGARILFMDQNLTTGATFGSGSQPAFAAIADVIQRIICPDSGPYGIVLWAEEPDAKALRTFLFERFEGNEAKLLPVFMAILRKGEYIDTTSGDVRDSKKLQTDLLERISASPQMKALFAWESDVSAAADAVLRSIVNLVPVAKRASADFEQELGRVYYRLAQAGSGVDRAEENPREAVNRVLVPILSDRIAEHDPEGEVGDEWKDALVIPPVQDKFAPVGVQAAVNSAIHQSFARADRSAPIQPTDLGAVLEFPYEDDDSALKDVFGIEKADIVSKEFFAMQEEDWANCSLRLIQIGAACDDAQPKKGPLLYLMALEWAFTNEDGTKTNDARLHLRKLKSSAEWRTPTLLVGTDMRAGKLSAFLNCTLSAPREAVAQWKPKYRLREELISKLTQEYARHISRPGIVNLSPDD